MDDTYFPEISKDDYESFRAIIHDLMPTYEEWLRYTARRVAHWSKTHNIVKVAVKPDDVLTYLRKSGSSADLNSLYVAAKFHGERREEANPDERVRPI
jgi:hypothetical protein